MSLASGPASARRVDKLNTEINAALLQQPCSRSPTGDRIAVLFGCSALGRFRHDIGTASDEMFELRARKSHGREVLRGVRCAPKVGMRQLRSRDFADCQVLLGVRSPGRVGGTIDIFFVATLRCAASLSNLMFPMYRSLLHLQLLLTAGTPRRSGHRHRYAAY